MVFQNQFNFLRVQRRGGGGFAVWVLLMAFGFGNTVVQGQTAAGDGHALDANQARQSGRLNTPRERFRLNDLNNAIVTGNVAGGKGFRGELGYSAASDFRDVTGSNDLFSVSANSYLPGLIYQRYGLLQVPTSRVAQNARYRWSLQPSIALDRAAAGSSVLADPFARHRRGRQQVSADPTGSLRMVVQRGRVRNSGVGAEVGMRLNSFGGSVLGQPEFALPRNFDTPATFDRGNGNSLLLRSGEQAVFSGGGSALGGRGVWGLGFNQSAFGGLELFGMSRGAVSATASRGLPQTDLERGTPSEQREKQALALESAAVFSALPVGADPYADLVAKMIRQVNSIPFEPGQVVYSETMLEAIRRFNAQFAPRRHSNDNSRVKSSSAAGGGGSLLIPDLAELRQLESNTLPALSGDADSQLALLTRAGETALGEAKFFVAERVFIQILEEEPENQLALAGLAHAQLGAGLFRSSALSIRTLFTRYPELSGIKFAANLKPSPARLGSIIMNLRQLRKTNPITDWGLLLAYTGRLAEDVIAIREGLDSMSESDSADPLLELLRTAWLAPEEVALPDEERGEGVRFGEEEPAK